jgi:tetratricopeptide (TPR) repeat protein
VQAAIARIGPQTRELAQARLWLWLGKLLDETPAQALPALERAVALYRRQKAPIALGLALMRLGRVLAFMGKYDVAEASLKEGRPLIEGAGPSALNFYHFNSGFLKNMMGDPAGAQIHYERALELAREARNELLVMAAIGNLAIVTWGLGELEAAAKSLRELVVLLRSSPASTRRLLGFGLMNLAELLVDKDIHESLALAREGLPLVRADGSAWVFSDYGSLRAGNEDKLAKAALLAGYADFAHAANGGTRSFVTTRARDRLRSLLLDKLPADELDRLLAEGAKLNEDDACRLALDD